MITDSQLYSLALFLGATSMLLIVIHHFLQVNAQEEEEPLAQDQKVAVEKR